MRSIKSMHWSNIDPAMRAAQRAAFSALGYDVEQHDATGTAHGAWMDGVLDDLADDDVVLFVDIDCVAMTADVIERAFASAAQGHIFGAAQTANYLPNRHFIYAGPMFLCIAKSTWTRLGRPSLLSGPEHDVGMRLSDVAKSQGVPLDLIMPSFVCRPRWPLADQACFGIGTFYAGAVFHLFESRGNKGFGQAFEYVAGCVAAGKPVDYVGLHARMNSLSIEARILWIRITKEFRRFTARRRR